MHFRFLCIATALFCLAFSAGCGSGEDSSKTGNSAADAQKKAPAYGKIQHVALNPTIDPDLAKKGDKIFRVICSACHKYDQRYVGPSLGGVVNRRTPEYIMNMVLDTEVMLTKDDTAHCLLQTYLTKMPNAQVNENDARACLENFRVVAPNFK